MTDNLSSNPWETARIVLKWCCQTSHDKWKRVGAAVLTRGFETAMDLAAGQAVIEVHNHREHRGSLEECLREDPIRFWDLVYQYWRVRGPHDGESRETIDLRRFKDRLE